MTKYWTSLYSLTFTRTIPVSKDIDVGDNQPRVMEEIRTYEIRFLLIRKKKKYYSIDLNLLYESLPNIQTFKISLNISSFRWELDPNNEK